jgi:hypothetical protein
MKICIAGWYLDNKLYDKIKGLSGVSIVSHKRPYTLLYNLIDDTKARVYSIDNIGLEFGCYSFYLNCIWDGFSDVLFMHDDVDITDISVFDDIGSLHVDQAYIFTSSEEEKRNGGKHGRCIFMSGLLLLYVKKTGGIWYDKDNHGYTGNGKKRPKPGMDFNAGINHFHKTMGKIRDNKSLSFNVVNRVFIDKIKMAKRGKF